MPRIPSVLLVGSLLASACGGAVAGTTSSATAAAATSAPAPASGAASASPAGSASGERKSDAAGVEVVASWSSDDPPSLKLTLDTHSVDLDKVDVAAVTRLRLDGAAWTAPTRTDAPKGGHHRAATVVFDSVTAAAFAAARIVEVRITDVAVSERVLRWDRGG